MALVQVTQELQNKVQKAMANPYRYERYERFAMQELLRACEEHSPAADVFVNIAHAALGAPRRTRHLAPVKNPPRVSAAA